MFSVSYIKGCWRCAGTQFVLVCMHCKTPNILWPLICIKFKGNKGMICSFSTIKSYFQSEFYSALTCSGASSWPGTGLCNLSCLCYDLCPFAALLFVPLPRSYSNKLLSSSVSFVRLKNKASVLQPDKRCLVVVWTLAVKWGGFSPEGQRVLIQVSERSRVPEQWDRRSPARWFFFQLLQITQINATLWDVTLLRFLCFPLHFTVFRQQLKANNVKAQWVHCNHRCTMLNYASLSLQPVSEWQNQRGGVRLRSAHLRCDLLLHRLLLFPRHTA